jgi:hypothetical protein
MTGRNWLGRFQQPVVQDPSLEDPSSSSSEPRTVAIVDDRLGWTGVTHEPLPLQSSVSLAQRFLDLNCASWRVAQRTVNFSIIKARGFFAREVSVDFGSVALGSTWHRTADRQLLTSLPHVAGLLCSAPFRFCATCLYAGYHSVLHQLTIVANCPIHNEPLLTTCMHCGSLTECIGRQLSRHAPGYLCTCCNAPICGDIPSVETYLPDTESFREMAARLAPWTRWLERCQQNLWPIEQILQQNARSISRWSNWTDVYKMLLGAALSLHPPPIGSPIERASVTPLMWSIRTAGDTSVHWSQAGQRYFPRGIYESTIRVLRTSRPSCDARMQSFVETLSSGRRVDSEDVNLRDLALYLLRMYCESEVGVQASATMTSLSKSSFAPFIHRTIRRLPFRAFLLSTYAALLSGLIRESERTGFIAADCLNILDSGVSIPFALLPELDTTIHSLQYSEGIALAVDSGDFSASSFWHKGSWSVT